MAMLTNGFQNSIILNNQGQVIEIGRGLIPYIANCAGIICYENNHLETGDVVIYISTTNLLNLFQCKKILQKVGVDSEILPNTVVAFAGVYEGTNSQLIFKNEDEIDIDTILCGHEIHIFISAKSKVISIDGTKLNYDEVVGSLLILNGNGIKYCDNMDIEYVLDGEDYQSKIHINDIENVFLPDVLDKRIVSSIDGILDGGHALVNYDSDVLSVTINSFGRNFSKTTVIEIGNEISISEELLIQMRQLNEMRQVNAENVIVEAFPSKYQVLVMDSHFSEINTMLKKASISNIAIMLSGESGTGKTHLAREIHKSSSRGNGPFIHVNCAAISPNLIESELFGYTDGAFTGAKKGGKKGLFEMAQDGTIFLDEIAELPMDLQGRLLEVIQEKTYFRVGGNEKIHTNFRLITATNRDLKQRVENRQFREDLFYRINVFAIKLPPLRERVEDIPLISSVLLPQICKRLDIEPLILSPHAIEKMKQYGWPGNIRELENILEKACILSENKIIFPEHIDISSPVDDNSWVNKQMGLKEKLEMAEKLIILDSLKKNSFERHKTARSLKIGRTSLFEKIKKHNIEG